MNGEERNFLYKFAVWIYRAIVVYKNDRRNDTDMVYHAAINQPGNGRRRLSNTYLDILLSLIPTEIYLAVDIDPTAELDATRLHATRKGCTPTTRYDAQYATIGELEGDMRGLNPIIRV